jgi:DNA polymerase III gamma/tau subunit
MLTKEAFNALLKTIEEPPPGVIFVLATTEEHKVPPTIVSRCQRLMFKLVNQDELKVHLRNVAKKESINIDEDALELVARRSGGGLRDALGLLDQAGLLSTSEKPVGVSDLLLLLGAVQEDVLLQISAGVRDKDGSAVLSAIHSLLVDGREPAVLIQEMAKHFLNLARSCYNLSAKKNQGAHSAHPILGSPSYLTGLTEQAETYDPAEIAQIVELLDKLEQNVRRSSQPAMNLEMGLLSICHRHEIRMLRELEERLAKLEGAMTDNGIEMPRAGANGASRATGYAAAGLNQTPARPPGQATVPGYLQPPAQSAPRPSIAPTAAPVQPAYSAPPPAVLPSASISSPPAPIADAQPQQAQAAPAFTAAPSSSALSLGDDEDEYVPDNSDSSDDEDANVPVPPAPLVVSNNPPVSAPAAAPAPNQVPAARPQAAQPPVESTSLNSSSVSNTELDELWSDITEALQGRHLPTYSILTTCAFPVSFDREKNDLVIGVRKDHFLKMIENKSEHIKGAFASISGKTISVRVKVISDDGFAAPAKAAGGRESRPKAPQSQPPEDSEESDRGYSQRPTAQTAQNRPTQSDSRTDSRPASRPDPSATSRQDSRSDARPDPRPSTSSESRSSQSGQDSAMNNRDEPPVDRKPDYAAARKAPNVASGAGDSGFVSDAYRIFEGPGSRLLN